jgi:predicted DNA-binding protein
MSEMVRTQVDLPRETIDRLRRLGEVKGITLPEQIQEAVRVYLEGQEAPVLQADDPIYRIAGEMDSGLGDLSTDHDRYLYRKDWRQSQGGTAG